MPEMVFVPILPDVPILRADVTSQYLPTYLILATLLVHYGRYLHTYSLRLPARPPAGWPST